MYPAQTQYLAAAASAISAISNQNRTHSLNCRSVPGLQPLLALLPP
jgi:hypothetical protein